MEENIKIYYTENKNNIENTHYHNNVEIIFITSGSSTFFIENKKIRANKNSLVVISNLEKHSMIINTYPYKRYVVSIDNILKINLLPSEIYIKIFQSRPIDFPYVFNLTNTEAREVMNLFDILINDDPKIILSSHYSKLIFNQVMIIIFRSNEYFFKRERDEFEEIIYKIQDYINEYYMEDISLEMIERKFYINKYEVSRHFKKITGYNFKTYLILVRISRAKDLLVNSNLTVAEISAETGYNSESLFVRMFKKYENTTPTGYRRAYKSHWKILFSKKYL